MSVQLSHVHLTVNMGMTGHLLKMAVLNASAVCITFGSVKIFLFQNTCACTIAHRYY